MYATLIFLQCILSNQIHWSVRITWHEIDICCKFYGKSNVSLLIKIFPWKRQMGITHLWSGKQCALPPVTATMALWLLVHWGTSWWMWCTLSILLYKLDMIYDKHRTSCTKYMNIVANPLYDNTGEGIFFSWLYIYTHTYMYIFIFIIYIHVYL